MEIIDEIIGWSATVIELLAVGVIVFGIIILALRHGTIRYLLAHQETGTLKAYKVQLTRPLLLGLELMVAADVIRTVVLEPTLTNVAVLGLLVLVRTILSWTLIVEKDGHWPWQESTKSINNETRI